MCLCFQLGAKVEKGLMFRSYEVVPELRTSLVIPSSGEPIGFKDSLAISFQINLNLDRGRFGYVCRLFLEEEPLDVLLSTPPGGSTFLGATGDHRQIVPLLETDAQLQGWQPVKIVLSRNRDTLQAFVNGNLIYSDSSPRQSRSSVSVCFGKVGEGLYSTTDVAPMVLRDLEIRVDARQKYSWPLSSEAEFQASRGLPARLDNPVWLEDYNCRWRKVWTFEVPTVTFICPDPARSRIWLISGGQVVYYNLETGNVEEFQSERRIKAGLATNDFVTLPDGTLAYADVDAVPELIRYSIEQEDWEKDNPRTRSSLYRHHNTEFCALDSSYVYLFGYGQHRYHKNVRIWNPFSGETRDYDLPGVFPRYLASTGIQGKTIYVMGGKGNEVGIQELGIRMYDDFFSLDLTDGTVSRLWKSPILQEEVASGNLLFEPGGDSFLALTYNPDVYESALQLRRFSLADGSEEPLANPIPYFFLDVSSEVRFFYDEKTENYVTVTSSRDADGAFRVSVYLLGNPILPPVNTTQKNSDSLWMAFFALVTVVGGMGLYRLLHQKPEAAPSPVYVKTEAGKASVKLLGGFRVVSVSGEDITGSFSPQTSRLFMILILYTAEKGGISNAKLKSLMWSDKSDESYNNNRGVTMKKIRTVLEQVGPIDFVSDAGQWRVVDPDGQCDYLAASRVLQGNPGMEAVLDIAAEGPLLPEVQQDYLDAFKSLHANRVLQQLEAFRSRSGVSPDLSIRIADAQLRFDSLDEEAVRAKCQALIAQKKLGSAQAAFSRFTEEYQRMMGEPFAEDFKDFVKK